MGGLLSEKLKVFALVPFYLLSLIIAIRRKQRKDVKKKRCDVTKNKKKVTRKTVRWRKQLM